jgi:hypothetical protein
LFLVALARLTGKNVRLTGLQDNFKFKGGIDMIKETPLQDSLLISTDYDNLILSTIQTDHELIGINDDLIVQELQL